MNHDLDGPRPTLFLIGSYFFFLFFLFLFCSLLFYHRAVWYKLSRCVCRLSAPGPSIRTHPISPDLLHSGLPTFLNFPLPTDRLSHQIRLPCQITQARLILQPSVPIRALLSLLNRIIQFLNPFSSPLLDSTPDLSFRLHRSFIGPGPLHTIQTPIPIPIHSVQSERLRAFVVLTQTGDPDPFDFNRCYLSFYPS